MYVLNDKILIKNKFLSKVKALKHVASSKCEHFKIPKK